MREASFTGVSRVTLAHEKGMTTSRHVATDFFLEVSDNQDKTMFLDKEEMPTKIGTKPLTQCFIQGLVGNIHHAHQKGFWDSAEHIRYIISELERGFAQVATIEKTTF